MLNFSFTLDPDVVRVMARTTGRNPITIRRRIESLDVPVTVCGMELIAIEEVQRFENPESDSGITIREILSPWVPNLIINQRMMLRDDNEQDYIDIQLIEFDWGEGEPRRPLR